jgi:hypothetical protein
MTKFTKKIHLKFMRDHSNHSFLFWLIVPLLLTWLAANYIIGALKSKPEWTADNIIPIKASVVADVDPYDADVPYFEKKGDGLVTLWFDDAWLTQYTVAAPILRTNGFPGTMAVATSLVGFPKYANWAQLRSLQRDGWEITNHTVAHDCAMNAWDQEKVHSELTQASRDLWWHKLTSNHFVSPCGVTSPAMVDDVKQQFISFRGTVDGYNDLGHLDPYNLSVQSVLTQTTLAEMKGWVDEAILTDSWLIIVFHQVGESVVADGKTYSITTEDFKALTDYIQEKEVQVVVPSQAISISHQE